MAAIFQGILLMLSNGYFADGFFKELTFSNGRQMAVNSDTETTRVESGNNEL